MPVFQHKGSIAKRKGKCCICGADKAPYGYWGKYYCKKCFFEKFKIDPDEIAEEAGKGHSGMVPFKTEEELKKALSQTFLVPSYPRPYLLQVPKGNKIFATLYLTHYPQSKGIVGRTINYLIIWKNKVAGIIGANSAPYAVKPVDEFFGITKENRDDMLLCIMNNEVFRLIVHEKNLATMVLKAFRYKLQRDHIKKYGHPLIGLITFVEPPRIGTIYKADNWVYLGMTKGYGTTRRGKRWFDRKWVKKKPKHIFAYKYKGKEVKEFERKIKKWTP